MTASSYMPIGRTLEAQMQNVILRRERWLIDHPEAAQCIVLIHPNRAHDWGYWLKAHSVPYAVPDRGRVGYHDVWFTDEVTP